MANQSKRVSELNVANTLAMTDRVVVLVNPTTTANVKTSNLSVLVANLALSNSVPANSSANGYLGTIRYDENYIYICTANNSWKRATLSSF